MKTLFLRGPPMLVVGLMAMAIFALPIGSALAKSSGLIGTPDAVTAPGIVAETVTKALVGVALDIVQRARTPADSHAIVVGEQTTVATTGGMLFQVKTSSGIITAQDGPVLQTQDTTAVTITPVIVAGMQTVGDPGSQGINDSYNGDIIAGNEAAPWTLSHSSALGAGLDVVTMDHNVAINLFMKATLGAIAIG